MSFNPPRILGQAPLVKEFITTWSKDEIRAAGAAYKKQRLFDGTNVILPDDVRYLDLVPFVGMKTRVTIEVIPW